MTDKTNVEQFLEDSKKFNHGLSALKLVVEEVLFLYDKIMGHGTTLTTQDLESIKQAEANKVAVDTEQPLETQDETPQPVKEENNGE